MASTGKTRGVENPIAEDMALIGDTRHRLHHESLPKKHFTNNYGKAELPAPGDDFRVDKGGPNDY